MENEEVNNQVPEEGNPMTLEELAKAAMVAAEQALKEEWEEEEESDSDSFPNEDPSEDYTVGYSHPEKKEFPVLELNLGGPMHGTTFPYDPDSVFSVLFATERGRVGARCIAGGGRHRIRLEARDEGTLEILKHQGNLPGWKFDDLPRASFVANNQKEFRQAINQALFALMNLNNSHLAGEYFEDDKESPSKLVVNWTERKLAFTQDKDQSFIDALSSISGDDFAIVNLEDVENID